MYEGGNSVVEANNIVGELVELAKELGQDSDNSEFLGCVSGRGRTS